MAEIIDFQKKKREMELAKKAPVAEVGDKTSAPVQEVIKGVEKKVEPMIVIGTTREGVAANVFGLLGEEPTEIIEERVKAPQTLDEKINLLKSHYDKIITGVVKMAYASSEPSKMNDYVKVGRLYKSEIAELSNKTVGALDEAIEKLRLVA